MHLHTVAAVWPLENLVHIEPLQGGINNRSFRVCSGAGDYILRIYPPSAKSTKIDFETRLLAALAPLDLPFRVPSPVPARSGLLAPEVPTDAGPSRAMLAPVIPGAVPVPQSAAQASAAGAALGSLAKALATLSLPSTGTTYATLEQIDPLLPDPLAAAELDFVTPEERQRLRSLLAAVLTERDHWYGRLPRQIIHGDYVPYNLLMIGDAVSAVLDFELASVDLRVIDFTIGLWSWLCWKGNLNWEWGEAFARGYLAQQRLTPEEVQAVPFLLRVRRAATLVWWAGRHRHGTADESVLKWAATSALEAEDWRETHGRELVDRLSRLL